MPEQHPVEVVISVTDDHLDLIDGVEERLRAAGMSVGETHRLIGTITGTIDAAKLDTIARLAGVGDVEPVRQIRLAPPESDIQ